MSPPLSPPVKPLDTDACTVTPAAPSRLSGHDAHAGAPFVLLHTHPAMSLVTDGLLLAPEQAPAFADAMALAAALARLRDDESARVQAAVAAGRAEGRAEGLAQGRAEGLQTAKRELADATARLAQQATDEAGALQQQVVALALLVLRRIAAGLAPPAVLATLARQAFGHLASGHHAAAAGDAAGPGWQGCQLRLPPALLVAVQAQLGDTPGLRLVADDSLDGLDCVLETPGGRLLAGLETQLARVQAQLAQASRGDRTATP